MIFLNRVFYGGSKKDAPAFKNLGILRFSFSLFIQSLIVLCCIPFLSLSGRLFTGGQTGKLESPMYNGREY